MLPALTSYCARNQSLSGYERDNEILQMLAECGLKGRRKGLKDAWLLKKCVGHNDEVTSVIITQDNSCFISGSRDGTLRIWDILSGQELCCLEDELYEMTTLGVNTVAITPDGKRVLSGFTLEFASGTLSKNLNWHTGKGIQE